MNLYKAIEKLETQQQVRAFLTDLCTPKEIESLIKDGRLQNCYQLKNIPTERLQQNWVHQLQLSQE